jgi:UDP-N-acetylmuramoyl-tripeptide--D-alanyl-D-alanine ligase
MNLSIDHLYRIYQQHPVISTDSRITKPGNIFFALKGEQFNANDFAAEAIERGAAYVVIDEPEKVIGENCIVVDDVLVTLQELAHYHRKQCSIPVIAITGTNGKTTTKDLIQAVLACKLNTLATYGNLNNHIGVPLTLLQIKKETEIAVIEMGANHRGEIDFLCRIAQPTHGLITNIGKAHLDGFGGFEGVVHAKTELFRYLKERGGTIFIHKDDPLLVLHASGLKQVTYGLPPADLAGIILDESIYASATVHFMQGVKQVTSSLFGSYNGPNILAAACTGVYFGIDATKIISAIERYQPSMNRSQIKDSGKNLLILDAYNANPSSMEQSLRAFASAPYENKVVILGDMLELGSESDSEHVSILALLETLKFKKVFLIGDIFTRLSNKEDWICFPDSDIAGLWLEHHPIRNTSVFMKGSRGMHLEKVLDCL